MQSFCNLSLLSICLYFLHRCVEVRLCNKCLKRQEFKMLMIFCILLRLIIQNDDGVLYFVFCISLTLRIQNDDGVKLVSREGRLYSHCMNTLGPRCQPSANYLHFIIVNNIAFPSNFIISKFIFSLYSQVSLVVQTWKSLFLGL